MAVYDFCLMESPEFEILDMGGFAPLFSWKFLFRFPVDDISFVFYVSRLASDYC